MISEVQKADDGMFECIVDDGVGSGRLAFSMSVQYCTVTSFVYKNGKTTCKSDCWPTAKVTIKSNEFTVASGSGDVTTNEINAEACKTGIAKCVADNGIDAPYIAHGCAVESNYGGIIVGCSVAAVIIIVVSSVACYYRNRGGNERFTYLSINS
ncbi:uncharacterized protein [Antedon mediterranea]|uniref:uncharacterized protein n=1 Tax=Antedon mediterranea TaxID=105859 RepID=UPI003AF9DD9F